MRNRLTERDLSRIVKRVINEQSLKECDKSSFRVMTKILQYNEELTLNFSKPSSGLVTVSANTGGDKFPCVCRKEELLPYIQ